MTQLAQAQAMIAAYLEAEAAVLAGKSVRIGGIGLDRYLTLEDLDKIRAGRQEWERKIASLQRQGAGVPTFGGARFALADVSNPNRW